MSLAYHSCCTVLARVLMLGASGVGKSALCTQFLSSAHINTYDWVQCVGQSSQPHL